MAVSCTCMIVARSLLVCWLSRKFTCFVLSAIGTRANVMSGKVVCAHSIPHTGLPWDACASAGLKEMICFAFSAVSSSISLHSQVAPVTVSLDEVVRLGSSRTPPVELGHTCIVRNHSSVYPKTVTSGTRCLQNRSVANRIFAWPALQAVTATPLATAFELLATMSGRGKGKVRTSASYQQGCSG
jgi:hypothetical protein